MATVKFHQTEDSAATVTGIKGSVLVIDVGCSCEVMKEVRLGRFDSRTEWQTVGEFASYSVAIDFAKCYVEGKA